MNYKDLINVDDFEKRDTFKEERGSVAFYCKDCEMLVEAERLTPTWYIFQCKTCQWTNIAIGTESGLKENYRLK